jgi:MOSC domain-containing protein YiiM
VQARCNTKEKFELKVISVNVGRPQIVVSNERPVSTAIFKQPVTGRVAVRRLNLDGDRQADLSVHGGPSKAVYGYPSEHYDYWKQELPEMELPWGMFGENLTTAGLMESELNIGDKFQAGTAVIMVTEPRMPCYKLGIRFGRSDIIKRFLASGRTGFYFAVLQEGDIATGDRIELLERDNHAFKLSDITRLYVQDKHNNDLLHRALQLDALPQSWKDYFQRQLEKIVNETASANRQ